MRIRFYIDEDVPFSYTQALINRGVDVITTQEAGNGGNSDLEQLQYAIEQSRSVVTHNIRDFMILHKDYLRNDQTHYGIIVSDQLPTGTLLRRTMKLWFTLDQNEMGNRIEFLSSWRQ